MDVASITHHSPPPRPFPHLPAGPGSAATQGFAELLIVDSVDDVEEAVRRARKLRRPVVVVLPGTGHDSINHANNDAVVGLSQRLGRPVTVIVLRYNNSVAGFMGGMFGIDSGVPELTTLFSALDRELADDQPLLVLSESQGGDALAQALRIAPKSTRRVDALVAFSAPNSASLPQALEGAAGGTALLVSHSDDIVPGLFGKITSSRIGGLLRAPVYAKRDGEFYYAPHNYEHDASIAADFLAAAVRRHISVAPIAPVATS